MIAEAIGKILEVAKPETHEIEDVHGIKTIFSTKPLHQVKAAPWEQSDCVRVVTLAGFVDLIQAKLEDADFLSQYVIHVEDERTVALKTRSSDEFGRRLTLITAQPVAFDRFQFGAWLNQEEFAIAVASRFADSADKQYVMQMASTLTNDATMTNEDDGFSQRATVKAGLRMKESTTLKPRVDLAPYRTFPEVDQPVSSFVFRARCDGESKPTLMLVEADGGRWKIDAISEIRRVMEAFGLNIPIVA